MLELFGIKEKVESVEEEKGKGITIFTYLTDIMTNKKGDIHIKNDPTLSKFNTFMILRFLSLDEGYLPYINVLNGFQSILTKEEAYKLLVLTIPKSKKFLRFPKKTTHSFSDEDVEILSKYFKCSEHKVEDFLRLELISIKDIDSIRDLYGGKK